MSAVRVRMPLETTDPLTRLREVGRQMADNKQLHRAEGMARLTDHVAGLGAAGVRAFARHLLSNRSLVNFSSSFPRWGTDVLVVHGRTAGSVIAVSNLPARIGIVAAFTQYSGRYSLCLTVDHAHPACARPLVDAFMAEMHALAVTGSQRSTEHVQWPGETDSLTDGVSGRVARPGS